jgi:nitroreductase
MSVFNTIRQRRSHKRFTTRPVAPEEIKALLEAAVLAPNHKLTQPWGFAVLGPRSRRKYAEIKAHNKVKDEANSEFANAKREKIAAETAAIPGVIVVTQKWDANPARAEEDYAAVFMAIQNMLLLATSLGLGSKVHTGRIMEEPQLRELIGAAQDERVVAIVHLGEPAEELPPKARIPAEQKTKWLP